MTYRIPIKTQDPDEKLDYQFDFSDELDPLADTIASVAVEFHVAGLAEDALLRDNTSNTVTIWLSGGTVGVTYLVGCQIVTAAGREYKQSMYLVIQAK